LTNTGIIVAIEYEQDNEDDDEIFTQVSICTSSVEPLSGDTKISFKRINKLIN